MHAEVRAHTYKSMLSEDTFTFRVFLVDLITQFIEIDRFERMVSPFKKKEKTKTETFVRPFKNRRDQRLLCTVKQRNFTHL